MGVSPYNLLFTGILDEGSALGQAVAATGKTNANNLSADREGVPADKPGGIYPGTLGFCEKNVPYWE